VAPEEGCTVCNLVLPLPRLLLLPLPRLLLLLLLSMMSNARGWCVNVAQLLYVSLVLQLHVLRDCCTHCTACWMTQLAVAPEGMLMVNCSRRYHGGTN
jgi:hypothetical protein